jgi:hypothetical protein
MKRWIICAVVAAWAIGGPAWSAAAQEEEGSVAGKWTGTYTKTASENVKVSWSLKQDGEQVTGTYADPGLGGAARVVERRVSGTFKEGVLTLGTTRAKVIGNTMAGRLRPVERGITYPFTATREK